MVSDQEAVVTLKEITKDTVHAVIGLTVTAVQKDFVAPNSVSIAEAYFTEEAWFRAVYADDTPVGFVMLYIDTVKPMFYVWRFMIDEAHQGKGYGRLAMSLLIEHVRQLPGATELLLSYVPGEGNPSPFYRTMGFEETGILDGDEKVMKLVL